MKILGHRGINQPENPLLPYQNTMEAFEYAVSKGADGVELDIFASADNKCFVIHDDDISKHGTDTGFITELESAQIKTKKIGTKGGYNIPALTDVLQFFKGTEKIINIEIKQPNIADIVLGEIGDSGIDRSYFIVSSFYQGELFKIRKEDNDIKVGILFGKQSREDKDFQRQVLDIANRLEPATFNMEKTLPYLEILDNRREKYIWNVGKQDMEGYLLEGLLFYENINFITDYPEELIKKLGR